MAHAMAWWPRMSTWNDQINNKHKCFISEFVVFIVMTLQAYSFWILNVLSAETMLDRTCEGQNIYIWRSIIRSLQLLPQPEYTNVLLCLFFAYAALLSQLIQKLLVHFRCNKQILHCILLHLKYEQRSKTTKTSKKMLITMRYSILR